ncbi:MAG: YdeI/OmpD-associated family protein [Candidatus Acidiferrales bacterium]
MGKKAAGEFLATIYRIWMLRYVDVPDNAVMSLRHPTKRGGRKGKPDIRPTKYIPVIARVNGRITRTTLVPAGGGRYRMQFNAVLRKAAQADVGEVVCIELSLDSDCRDRVLPADLRAALNRHPKAKRAFEQLPPGLRRQLLKWMDSAKGEATRIRRIEIVIDRMVERAILGSHSSRKEPD